MLFKDRKRILPIILIVLIITGITMSLTMNKFIGVQGANLLEGGDFEDSNSIVLDSKIINKFSGDNKHLEIINTDSKEGSNCLKLGYKEADRVSTMSYTATSLKGGRKYRVSFYAKVKETNKPMNFAVSANKTGNLKDKNHILSNSVKGERWKEYKMVFETGKNSNKAVLEWSVDKGSIGYIDNVTLQDLGEAKQLPELSRGSRLFVEKGLQIPAWIPTDEATKERSWEKHPSTQDILDLGITTVQYYGDPLYNSVLYEEYKKLQKINSNLPDLKWATANAPYGKHLSSTSVSGDNKTTGRPTEEEKEKGFLSKEQMEDLKNLQSICFGDEENYSDILIDTLKEWFDVSKKHYPEALVHHNEIGGAGGGGAFDEMQLRDYVQRARPDFITYDIYYFREGKEDKEIGGTYLDFYKDMIRYRKVAKEGYDGSGSSPIPWGQYFQAWRTGPGSNPNGFRGDGWYEITESQLYLTAFGTWTFGGKWFSMFRWLKDNPSYLFADYRLDENGNVQKYHLYDKYKEMIKQSKNLGYHLVRLNSTNVAMLQGKHLAAGKEVLNDKPMKDFPEWNKDIDKALIDSLSVKNLGSTNDGLPGDVFIGYFDPLPGLKTTEFFTTAEPKYFMILNGLTHGNGRPVEEQRGSSYETRQEITVVFNLGANKGKVTPEKLKKVSRLTGDIVNVPLKALGNDKYEMTVELGGGMGDLYFWELGKINSKNKKEVKAEDTKDTRLTGDSKEAKNIEIMDLKERTINIGWIKDTYSPIPVKFDDLSFEYNLWNRRINRIQKESKVKINFVPDINWSKEELIEAVKKAKSGTNTGIVPDILIVPDEWTWSGLITNESILPASSFKAFDFNNRKWNKSYKTMTTYNGNIYGIYAAPSPAGSGLFVNSKLLKELGIKENLYSLQNSGGWNWNKLREIIDKLEASEKAKNVYAFGNTEELLRQMIFSNGSTVIENITDKALVSSFNNDSFKDALKFYNELNLKSLILNKPQGKDSKWYLEQFQEGKLLFIVLPFEEGYKYLKQAETVGKNTIPGGEFSMPVEDWQFLFFPKGDKAGDYSSILNNPAYPVMLSSTVNPEEVAYIWNQLTEEFSGVQHTRFLSLYPAQRAQDKNNTIKMMSLKNGVGDISKSLGAWNEIIKPHIEAMLWEGKEIDEDKLKVLNTLVNEYLNQKGY
jgi:hypothetical protein